MPRKGKPESQEEQSARFRKAVQDMVDAGELNPTEAEERFGWAMDKLAASALLPSKPGKH